MGSTSDYTLLDHLGNRLTGIAPYDEEVIEEQLADL